MKLYLTQSVYDAALDRIRRLYDEFPEICVNFSGGKDSTVLLNLTLKVAEERGRLPVNVLFLDQEAEWENVITYIRSVMGDPRVRPWWFQAPFKIFNATSTEEPWLYCWKEGAQWIRKKEPNSIHENRMGTDRFGKLFDAFGQTYFPHTAFIHLAGVRAEESPGRLKGLTAYPTYKDITWGRVNDKKRHHYTFYPLYDWSFRDIWKAIHEHNWSYCALYDYMYQYGIPVMNMRVSNVHHETAIDSLRFLQEIEPQTWDAITDRVSGVNAVGKIREAYLVPANLPPMFASWKDYRDYLIDNLITDPSIQMIFRRQCTSMDKWYVPEIEEKVTKVQIAAILVNDYHGTKFSTFKASHASYMIKKGKNRDRFSHFGKQT